MLISLIVIAAALAIFFMLKERFDQWPRAFKYGAFAVLTLVIATVMTMELFIYVHERLIEFRKAVAAVPTFLVVFVFLLLLAGAWWALVQLGTFNKERFQQFIHDTFMPRAKETFKEVAKTGRMGWQGLKLGFRNPLKKRTPSTVEEETVDPKNSK